MHLNIHKGDASSKCAGLINLTCACKDPATLPIDNNNTMQASAPAKDEQHLPDLQEEFSGLLHVCPDCNDLHLFTNQAVVYSVASFIYGFLQLSEGA